MHSGGKSETFEVHNVMVMFTIVRSEHSGTADVKKLDCSGIHPFHG